ncbi:MAG: hypothetical protein AB2693_17560, partial [Candidatus Thiodiazotropha sp.]
VYTNIEPFVRLCFFFSNYRQRYIVAPYTSVRGPYGQVLGHENINLLVPVGKFLIFLVSKNMSQNSSTFC